MVGIDGKDEVDVVVVDGLPGNIDSLQDEE